MLIRKESAEFIRSLSQRLVSEWLESFNCQDALGVKKLSARFFALLTYFGQEFHGLSFHEFY